MSARTALVTGGTGFIGSHLIAELLAGGWSVRCVVRPTSNLQWLNGLSIQPVTDDMSESGAASLGTALDGVTTVFHLAGVTSSALEETFRRVNVGGTQRIIAAMREHNPVARLIYVSSLAAGGPVNGKRTINETDDPRPISEYGRSKLAAESIVQDSGLEFAIVRPPPVYGPRDSGIFSLFRLVSYGIAPHIAERTQRLSIVHVSDLSRGLVRAAEYDARGIYYMTDGHAHTWEEIIEAIAKGVGRTPKYIAVSPGVADVVAKVERFRGLLMGDKPKLTPDRLLELSQNEWTCSDAFARLDIDYVSSVSLTEGMLSTAQWYRANGWLPK